MAVDPLRGLHSVPMPIESVAVKMPAGFNMLAPKEWQALDKEERFELIKANRVAFLSDGRSVPTRQALIWLAENMSGGD